jgi:hypothetical protein
MRAITTHLLATIVLFAICWVWYAQKEAQLENYTLLSIQKLESIKPDALALGARNNLGIELAKTALDAKNSEIFSSSGLSQNFVSQKRDDENKTITKINDSLAKIVFSKMDKYKPFVVTTRVDGNDFVATFAPTSLESTSANGYLVRYIKDDTIVKIERKFNDKLFILIMISLLIKAILMARAAFLQNKKNLLIA